MSVTIFINNPESRYKFIENVYHKQNEEKVWFSEHVYFMQLYPIIAGLGT